MDGFDGRLALLVVVIVAGWASSTSGPTVLAAPAAARLGTAGVVQGRHVPVGQAVGGALIADFHACPPGAFASDSSPKACPETEDFGELQIFVLGSGDHRRTLDDADIARSQVIWDDLPPGDYVLNALALPPGYGRFFVPGLDGINAPPERGYTAGPNEGYLIPIGAERSIYEMDVFLIPEPAPGAPTIDLELSVFACAPGVEAAPNMDGLGCTPVAPPSRFEPTLEGDALPSAAPRASATPTATEGWV